jgi:hypothetical protein
MGGTTTRTYLRSTTEYGEPNRRPSLLRKTKQAQEEGMRYSITQVDKVS